MNTQEIPVAFACKNEPLIGVVHVPESRTPFGVLAIVAGGPQYRAGCCRQLVYIARAFAQNGIPVMRFDYCGLGDSAGEYKGFLHIADEIKAAIDIFAHHAPQVKEIILWGGCDAASAALIHGPEHPMVKGMILGNPYAHTEAGHAKVVVKHYYLKRLREKSFWIKLISMRMNPFKTLVSLFSTVKTMHRGSTTAQGVKYQSNIPFPERMRLGAEKFNGRILMLMSGLSMVSKEFDALVNASKNWQETLRKSDVTRIDLPDADQAFSTIAAREELTSKAIQWLTGSR